MLESNQALIDLIGWIGAGALLVAYALVSTKRVDGQSTSYQSLNAMGSVFLMANTVYYGAYPSAFVNIIWLGIAVYALRKTLARLLASSC